jgi:hypothetical protein
MRISLSTYDSHLMNYSQRTDYVRKLRDRFSKNVVARFAQCQKRINNNISVIRYTRTTIIIIRSMCFVRTPSYLHCYSETQGILDETISKQNLRCVIN